MTDLTDDSWGIQVEKRYRLKIQQVGYHFDAFIVDSSWNKVGFHVLGSASTQRLISTIFNKSQLSSIRDHAEVGTVEVKFLISCSFPIDLACRVGLHVSDNQSLKGVSYCIPVVVEIDFGDLQSVSTLKHTLSALSLSLDEDLTWRNIVKQITTLFEFFDACIINIDWPTEISCNKFAAVVFPAYGCDSIVIFNLFASVLFPLSSLRVEVVDVEAIEVTKSYCVSRRVESCHSEILYFLLMSVVESL